MNNTNNIDNISNMDNIYFNCILTKKIVVESKYLNENIDEHIIKYLKKKIENLCIDEGFVKEDSVKFLKKSIGMLSGSKFTGDITYEIAYTADICNPVIGNIIDCKVKFINKLGILGNNGPIVIIVGKQFHTNDDELNKINENDIIKVEIIAKKFHLNDSEIKVVGRLWYNNDKIKNNTKKELISSSDLTPIIPDDEFMDNDMNDMNEENSEFNEEYSMEDEDEDEDVDEEFIESDDENHIKVENPDENNLDADDIELEDEDENEDEDDLENSDIDYD